MFLPNKGISRALYCTYLNTISSVRRYLETKHTFLISHAPDMQSFNHFH